MAISRTEMMSPEERGMYAMLEKEAEKRRGKWPEQMTEEELAFARHYDERVGAYAWNLFEQNKLNEQIYAIKDPEAWKAFFCRRARRLAELYEENEAIVREVKEALKRPLTPGLARFWTDAMMMHFHNMMLDDLHCTMPILEKLFPWMEKEYFDPTERVMLYYGHANRVLNATFNLGPGDGREKYEYARKLIAQKDKAAEIKTPFAILSGYGLMCYFGLQEKIVSLEESAALIQEMCALWEQLLPQVVSPSREQCMFMVDQSLRFWLEMVDADIDEAPQDVREYYCALAEKKNAELAAMGVPQWQYPYSVRMAQYHARVLRGEIGWDMALKGLFDDYCAYLAHQRPPVPADEEEGFDTRNVFYGVSGDLELMQFMIGTTRALEHWAERCTDRALCRRVMERLIGDLPPVLHLFTNAPLETSQQLTDICFAFLPWLDSVEKKEHWILDLVTKKQFVTHVHSVMVQKLAEAVAASLRAARPELFEGVKAQIGGRDLMEFISKCALFHDVGKNDIATIINVQARALDEPEYQAIRRHPYFGYSRFLADADFSCYRDVILCHHKSYDGKSGYPEDADNTASPYGIIIDLITICDCLDAGTDTLGRNYKRAKSVEELIEELAEGAGTRYDPEIVFHIQHTPALVQALKRIIEEERMETAYEIARQY